MTFSRVIIGSSYPDFTGGIQNHLYEYWEERVKQSRRMDAIYTVGMRGVHDSGMEGVGSMEEKVGVLGKVISDQRELFRQYINEDVSEVPQSL